MGAATSGISSSDLDMANLIDSRTPFDNVRIFILGALMFLHESSKKDLVIRDVYDNFYDASPKLCSIGTTVSSVLDTWRSLSAVPTYRLKVGHHHFRCLPRVHY